MVSNAFDMDQLELIGSLKTFKKKYADDPEYAKLRAELPKTWPL